MSPPLSFAARTARPPDRIVRCAECATAYRLPEAFLGARGARVRCRECGARFEVRRAVAGQDPASMARRVVEELAGHAPVLAAAAERGRLFAEAGDLVFAAWDRYRRDAGERASASVFRAALRERWGVDLPGGPERDPPAS